MHINVNGISIACREVGSRDAPPVILHHPLATDLSFWDATASVLAATHRVVRFDARGHGNSAVPVGPYDFATLAADVVGLMDALGIATAQFVGLSMGGMLAPLLANAYADRFSSITIASAGPKTPEPMRDAWHGRIAAVREGGMASQVAMSLDRWLTPATRAERPELADRCAAMILATPVEGYAGWCAAIATLDNLALLPRIGMPTLVIAGEADGAVPLPAVTAMAGAIPGAAFHVLPGLAHFTALEDPDAFHAILLPFLARHAH